MAALTPIQEHEAYMRQAMEIACQNLQRPFGALLVDTREGEVIASAVNRAYRNPIAHSELEVIHEAVRRFGGDVRWGDCTLYVTAEPCPMCMSGILWTGIPQVVFGSSVLTLRDLGYRHIALRAAEVVAAGTGDLGCTLVGGILESECDALFAAAMKLERKSRG
ncbi:MULTISPECIES: nucleoside deaminase [Oscillatoriales]|uniref:nucleoside deaminase n=1 Tax=Limnospira TaxID=2596745 RepID=UPI001686F725|nr:MULTISPECIES: nucleoside deaminase [Oscillatoriales]MBD2575536.1 nucleoside deaminase [Arthrospira platensis FACHB-971]MDT9272525.1 nucleoside deaminase [Limnospira sp. PMC 1234.20]MDT9313448.1 nucleoside deaminase [Limnospira sp. Paracas R14]